MEPKLKAGDRVRVTRVLIDTTIGRTYEVTGRCGDDFTFIDDAGDRQYRRFDGRFELVVDEPTPAPTADIVVKPSHYTRYVIEPITFIMKNGLSFEIGNIVKYATRAGGKVYDGMTAIQSEVTDLRKVIRYAEMRINQIEGREVL